MRYFCALLLLTFCCLTLPDFAGAQAKKPAAQPKQNRVDHYGDPLPDGALARLGTTRYRHGGSDLLGFTLDGKALLYHGGGLLRWIDVVTGTEIKVIRHGNAEPRIFGRIGFGPSAVL